MGFLEEIQALVRPEIGVKSWTPNSRGTLDLDPAFNSQQKNRQYALIELPTLFGGSYFVIGVKLANTKKIFFFDAGGIFSSEKTYLRCQDSEYSHCVITSHWIDKDPYDKKHKSRLASRSQAVLTLWIWYLEHISDPELAAYLERSSAKSVLGFPNLSFPADSLLNSAMYDLFLKLQLMEQQEMSDEEPQYIELEEVAQALKNKEYRQPVKALPQPLSPAEAAPFPSAPRNEKKNKSANQGERKRKKTGTFGWTKRRSKTNHKVSTSAALSLKASPDSSQKFSGLDNSEIELTEAQAASATAAILTAMKEAPLPSERPEDVVIQTEEMVQASVSIQTEKVVQADMSTQAEDPSMLVYKNDIDQLDKKLIALQQKYDQAQETIAQLQAAAILKEKDSAGIETALKDTIESLRQAKEKMEKLRKDNADLGDENKTLAQEKEGLVKEKDLLQRKLELKESELADLHASKDRELAALRASKDRELADQIAASNSQIDLKNVETLKLRREKAELIALLHADSENYSSQDVNSVACTFQGRTSGVFSTGLTFSNPHQSNTGAASQTMQLDY